MCLWEVVSLTYSVIYGINSQIKGNIETELENAQQTITQIINHSD